MKLQVLGQQLAVCRLANRRSLPPPPDEGFWSVTCAGDDVSLICDDEMILPGAKVERPFRALAVVGPLPFHLTGIVAGLSSTLAAADIPLLAVGSFDTDYLLVKADRLKAAIRALEGDGHVVQPVVKGRG